MSNPTRVLIVEDDTASRGALAAILRTKGWTVQEAGTAARAIAEMTTFVPDFVLLDLMLPDADGATVLHSLRAKGFTAKVVVMTGAPERPGIGHLWAEGIDAVLAKPLNLSELFYLLKA